MARFLFWSDLHCEFEPFEVPLPAETPGACSDAPARSDIDGILIAGDTDVKCRHIDLAEEVWDIWRCPILMIDGNHEPYGAKRIQKLWALEDQRIAERRSKGVDIEILRGTSRTIGDTRIIGATLWTDLQLFPDRAVGAERAVASTMNDYSKVRFFDERTGIYRKMLPGDTRAMHVQEKARIFELLAQPFDGRTIVMTHHLPVKQMLNPKRLEEADIISAAYASDLASEIEPFPVDAWICGHSHDAVEYLLSGQERDIRFLRNIRGYPGQGAGFDPLRILDSNAPRMANELATEELMP